MSVITSTKPRQALPCADDFFAYLVKREAIRQRRAAGQPKPWTDDPILRSYKFCNVYREDDRTLQQFRDELYHPNKCAPAEQLLLNAAIARYFGTVDFMRAIGWQETFDPALLRSVARSRLDAKEQVFTGAYIVTNNGRSAPKEEVVVEFMASLWRIRNDVIGSIQKTLSMERAMAQLMRAKGFGSFMAAQVLLDTRWTKLWPERPIDRMTFCGVGPGAQRGAGRVKYGRKVELSVPETLTVCRELLVLAPELLPPEFDDEDIAAWELADIQHNLCEYDKYCRVRNGEGKPRSRYPGI
jgi:hypothetical protein